MEEKKQHRLGEKALGFLKRKGDRTTSSTSVNKVSSPSSPAPHGRSSGNAAASASTSSLGHGSSSSHASPAQYSGQGQASVPIENLAYQPRIRTKDTSSSPAMGSNSEQSPASQAPATPPSNFIPLGPSSHTGRGREKDTSIEARLQSVVDQAGPSQPIKTSSSPQKPSQLDPLSLDTAVLSRNPSNRSIQGQSRETSPRRTPKTGFILPTGASSPSTPKQPPSMRSLETASPETPRPADLSRGRSIGSITGARESVDSSHTRLHLSKPRLPHPARNHPGDLNRTLAKGKMTTAAGVKETLQEPLYFPAAFPVAPSYHEKAHPELQPPQIAFNLLDGPLSRTVLAPEGIDPAKLQPTETLPPPRLQRPAIKVKIITWNMGGAALPKGDLEVLLGRVGGYVPPDAEWDADMDGVPEGMTTGLDPSDPYFNSQRRGSTKGKGIAGQEDVPRMDRIPPLPHDDGHPYHILVVAGQECPWGDGKRIATGLGVAGELSDLARNKSRAHHPPKSAVKEKEREVLPRMPSVTDLRSPDGPPNSLGLSDTISHETAATNHQRMFGGKGWSDMCDDWLCKGPVAQTQATKGLAATTQALVQGSVLGTDDVSRDVSRAPSPEPPDITSPSAESGSYTSPPLPEERRPSGSSSLNVPVARTPFSRKKSSSNVVPQLKSASSTDGGGENIAKGRRTPSPLPSPAATPIIKDFAIRPPTPGAETNIQQQEQLVPPQHPNKDREQEKERLRQQLSIQIPDSQRDGTPHALGAYELIAKERCAMIYMAVYCWRGCRDRVRGISKGQVKSGMLAGRVGNKGAVGISVKLGRTRLLFVNSHLAAHESRVQTRLDNIVKIKRELRVDTFLPEADSRNRLDDVTEMFDHAFWFGDLNFRVDITRQHADWLVMNKKYSQALEFDQLRKVMKDGVEFQSFREADITFPPTYKYDVLKTIKKPKREKTVRRILHRRGHTATDVVTSPISGEDGELDSPFRAEMSASSNSPTKKGALGAGPAETSDIMGDDSSSIASTENWESNMSNRSQGDSEDESGFASSSSWSGGMDSLVSSNTNAAAQGGNIISHGAAIKAKWKIMDMVRSATGQKDPEKGRRSKRRSKEYSSGASTPDSARSPSKRYSGGSGVGSSRLGGINAADIGNMSFSSPDVSVASDDDDDEEDAEADQPPAMRHQPSITSIASVLASADADSKTSPAGSSGKDKTHDNGKRRSFPPALERSSSSFIERPGMQRADSALTASQATLGENGAESQRSQQYDTSAKQRVPSWTDRILWRSNVAVRGAGEHEGLSHRMQARFSNAFRAAVAAKQSTVAAGSNVRGSMSGGGAGTAGNVAPVAAASTKSTSVRSTPARSQTFSHPINGRSDFDNDNAASDGPDQQPHHHHPHVHAPNWLHRHPKAAKPGQVADGTKPPMQRNVSDVSLSPRRLGFLAASSPSASPKATPSVIYPESPLGSKSTLSAAQTVTDNSFAQPRRTASLSTSSIDRPKHPRAPNMPKRTATNPNMSPGRPPAQSRTASEQALSSLSASQQQGQQGGTDAANGNTNANAPTGKLSSWWSAHAPAIFTAPGAAAAFASFANSSGFGSTDGTSPSAGVGPQDGHHHHLQNQAVPPRIEIIGPRRGEIECLLYSSLSDREMLALEGRSDHRPVKWVGSIGI